MASVTTLTPAQQNRSLKSQARSKKKVPYNYLERPGAVNDSFTPIDPLLEDTARLKIQKVFTQYGADVTKQFSSDSKIKDAFSRFFPDLKENVIRNMKKRVLSEAKRRYIQESSPKLFWQSVRVGLNEVVRSLEAHIGCISPSQSASSGPSTIPPAVVLLDASEAASAVKAVHHLGTMCRLTETRVIGLANLASLVSTPLRPLPRALTVALFRGQPGSEACTELDELIDWLLITTTPTPSSERPKGGLAKACDDQVSIDTIGDVPPSGAVSDRADSTVTKATGNKAESKTFNPGDVYIFTSELTRIADLKERHADRLCAAQSLVDDGHQSEEECSSNANRIGNKLDAMMMQHLRGQNLPNRNTHFYPATLITPSAQEKEAKRKRKRDNEVSKSDMAKKKSL